jgi:hypothetical protein
MVRSQGHPLEGLCKARYATIERFFDPMALTKRLEGRRRMAPAPGRSGQQRAERESD